MALNRFIKRVQFRREPRLARKCWAYWVRWPTAAPPAGRGSRRLTVNIDVSVTVSEKSCFRQAPTRTGYAYGGARTNRCRGRHCAFVAQ